MPTHVSHPTDALLPPLTSENYINRELSWIDFNYRVLAMAKDQTLPLLERIKFLAIVSNNTDEFFMVRVAYLHNKIALNSGSSRPDGWQPEPLLREIRKRIDAMMREQRALMHDLLNRLAEHGIVILPIAQMADDWRLTLRRYFEEEVFPVLTPLAVDQTRPFPFISNLSLNLAIRLHRIDHKNGEEFVRLKIPDTLPRLIHLEPVLRKYGTPDSQARDTFVWLEDLIGENLEPLFPGMEVTERTPFRVTRNADIDYENEREDKDLDISDIIRESLREREFGSIVRLAVMEGTSHDSLQTLVEETGVDMQRDVYFVNGALGGSSLFELGNVQRPDLKYPVYIPRMSDCVELYPDIFTAIRERDWLMHHPYDTFAPVEKFFEQAAQDDQVLAIKATLYRVGRRSPIVQALMQARDNGKQVTALVELKARFDEENNLEWAKAMEQKGVHVLYGVEELPVKTHAKVAMVVRKEEDGVRRYVHLGTGNYNAATARLYTDLGLLTCNREIGDDASRLFNRLTGFAPGTTYSRLLVAPEHLRYRLMSLIDGEIAAAQAGKPARLIFKMNQLEEDTMIRKLYQASQAGVQVDILVRGLCCLRPGVAGMSENIRVRSIVGRFLEHSRVFYFQNAPADQRVYMGSADLMRRNLYNRVEVVFPVMDPRLQQQALNMLATCMADTMQAWELGADGTYTRLSPADGEAPLSAQEAFMKESFGSVVFGE
ncbi:MAG: polyphosphate kinase 1 [Chloroflexota bacterium]|nr:polyphosphate kinase 1 [Chloroflexota bacterium]